MRQLFISTGLCLFFAIYNVSVLAAEPVMFKTPLTMKLNTEQSVSVTGKTIHESKSISVLTSKNQSIKDVTMIGLTCAAPAKEGAPGSCDVKLKIIKDIPLGQYKLQLLDAKSQVLAEGQIEIKEDPAIAAKKKQEELLAKQKAAEDKAKADALAKQKAEEEARVEQEKQAAKVAADKKAAEEKAKADALAQQTAEGEKAKAEAAVKIVAVEKAKVPPTTTTTTTNTQCPTNKVRTADGQCVDSLKEATDTSKAETKQAVVTTPPPATPAKETTPPPTNSATTAKPVTPTTPTTTAVAPTPKPIAKPNQAPVVTSIEIPKDIKPGQKFKANITATDDEGVLALAVIYNKQKQPSIKSPDPKKQQNTFTIELTAPKSGEINIQAMALDSKGVKSAIKEEKITLVDTVATPTPPPAPTITYVWNTGDWGQCTAECGGGTQTRTVQCKGSDNSIGQDNQCAGNKPTNSQACNTQACPVAEAESSTSTAGGFTMGDASSSMASTGSTSGQSSETSGTIVADVSAPLEPSNVNASDSKEDKVEVTWNAVDNVSHYTVYRCETSSTDSCDNGFEATNSPYDDTDMEVDVIFFYRVKACNSGGCSPFSNYNKGKRKAPKSAVPSTPSSISASDYLPDKIRINWNDVDNTDSYKVYRCNSNNKSTCNEISTTNDSIYDDNVLTSSKFYRVKACNSGGCSSYSVSAEGSRWNYQLSTISASDNEYIDRISLDWYAVGGADYYKIFRCSDNSTDSCSQIETRENTDFNDTNAPSGVNVRYRYKACKSTGCSGYSNNTTGVRKLHKPGGVNASDNVYPDKIQINWNAVTNATSYDVKRCYPPTGTCTNFTTNSTSYDDTDVPSGKVYTYRVKACNQGCSDFSIPDPGER